MLLKNRYNDFQNTKYQIPNTNYPFDKMEEECGIFGLYSDNEVDTFSLSQFGCLFCSIVDKKLYGISVSSQGKIITVKDEGLVLDVLKPFQILKHYWEMR